MGGDAAPRGGRGEDKGCPAVLVLHSAACQMHSSCCSDPPTAGIDSASYCGRRQQSTANRPRATSACAEGAGRAREALAMRDTWQLEG